MPRPSGAHRQAISNSVAACTQFSNAYRVLTHEGRISPGFHWGDPSDTRNGDGKGDPARIVISDDFRGVLAESP